MSHFLICLSVEFSFAPLKRRPAAGATQAFASKTLQRTQNFSQNGKSGKRTDPNQDSLPINQGLGDFWIFFNFPRKYIFSRKIYIYIFSENIYNFLAKDTFSQKIYISRKYWQVSYTEYTSVVGPTPSTPVHSTSWSLKKLVANFRKLTWRVSKFWNSQKWVTKNFS